jgi:YycE-like C-terminal domain
MRRAEGVAQLTGAATAPAHRRRGVHTALATLGHLPVEAENPYWTEHGAVTVEDPDRWRVVLMPQRLT